MTLVSVITPTHDPAAPYLEETYKSLCQQEPEWEWLLQFDGNEADWEVPDYLKTGDPRIKLDFNGEHLGVAYTRTLAIARSSGEFVQVLDADDALLPGAMAALQAPLLADPSLAFCAARTRHWVNGELMPKNPPVDDHGRARIPKPPGGLMQPGDLGNYWFKYDRMPFATQGVMWRRKIMLAYGGQTALDVGEDADTACAVSELHPVWFLEDDYTLLYRNHEHSLMHQKDYFSNTRPRANAFIAQRIKAIRYLQDPASISKIDDNPAPASEEYLRQRAMKPQGEAGLISVITPTHKTDAPYLEQAYQSLCDQEGVEWEWLLQFDGPEWEAPSYLRGDPRVKLECNRKHFGTAITRNLALARSRGHLIHTLDADDWLLPGALSGVAETMDNNPEIGYSLGRVRHLVNGEFAAQDDSGRPPITDKPAFGVLLPGTVHDFWAQHHRMPFALNNICWRRQVLLAAGGWAATKIGEDSSLFLRVSNQYSGHWLDQYTLVYRQHDDSAMHQENYWEVLRPRTREFTVEVMQAFREVLKNKG